MSVSDTGPKTFAAVRSDKTGTVQFLHRAETKRSFMATQFPIRKLVSILIRSSPSGTRSVICIHGIRTADHVMPTYMVEGADLGLARAAKYSQRTGEEIEKVTENNRHLPPEALFGMTLDSNWNCDQPVKESTSDTPHQFVDYEDFEMFYRNVDQKFVRRLGKQDYAMAIINIEENYTKSHVDEPVDILTQQYRDVLTFRVDAIVARVGKLATDQGEVASRTNGRHQLSRST